MDRSDADQSDADPVDARESAAPDPPRRVLITGASSGIGEATARRLAAQGHRVAGLARRRERLEALAEETGGVAVPCDVSDPEAAAEGVAVAAERLGGLDVLVNNAGVFRLGTIADTSIEDWRAMVDVNVLGLLAVTQAAIPHLKASPRPDVVMVSSMSGRRVPRPTGTVYSATKHATHAIATGLRKELFDDGVRVTTVSPGIVETDLVADQAREDETAARFHDRMRSLGVAPEQIAAAIAEALDRPHELSTVEISLVPTAQEL